MSDTVQIPQCISYCSIELPRQAAIIMRGSAPRSPSESSPYAQDSVAPRFALILVSNLRSSSGKRHQKLPLFVPQTKSRAFQAVTEAEAFDGVKLRVLVETFSMVISPIPRRVRLPEVA
jgi:hypothetical protein